MRFINRNHLYYYLEDRLEQTIVLGAYMLLNEI